MVAPFPRRIFRITILSGFLFILTAILWFHHHRRSLEYRIRNLILSEQPVLPKKKPAGKPTSQRLNLDDLECRAAFPELFNDIDASVARDKFVFRKSNADYNGLVQGRIRDGNLYILTTAPDTLPTILQQRTAILSQIHRALTTSPTTLPDTYFAFVTNDVPKNNTWAFSRPNKESSYNTWLIPPFAAWSWPKPHLGSMSEILQRIDDVENTVAWEDKTDKVVWRGTPWFNPVGHPNLRKDLVKVARGKEWADIEALRTHPNETNSIPIEDFCRYKYVVYTEGVTYSGRLPYHQACASVLITPPVTWMTTSALLLRPIGAGDLFAGDEARERRRGKMDVSLRRHGEIANAISVKPDFEDLEAVIMFLRKYPHVARRIARNQRDMVVGAGYLSLSAEVCYWRALIRGWAQVVEVDEEEWGTDVGERYETWLLKQVSSKREGGTRGKTGGPIAA